MCISNDIKPYIDGYGLVALAPVSPETMQSSDNGPLFTAQYLILRMLQWEGIDQDALNAINSCIDVRGYLHRTPVDISEDAPDDHYGVLSLFHCMTHLKLPN